MIITKQQLEGGAYEVSVDVANRDVLSETGPLKPGMIAGKDGTRVILLDQKGKPEEGPPDLEEDRLRTESWVLIAAAVGSLFAAAAQFVMLMSSRYDAALVSHEAKARISDIFREPSANEESDDRNAIPRLLVKSE